MRTWFALEMDCQRKIFGATVAETAGSHAVYVSKPQAVAALIEQAAKRVNVAAK
jgi:hypothetical protein